MTEQEKYSQGQKASGIEVGDTVRVVRKNERGEGGWDVCWAGTISAVGQVDRITETGVHIKNGVYYPYFVLEIIKKANGTKPIKVKEPCMECKHLDTDICVDCPTFDGHCTCHNGNAPCGYCEGSLWEEKDDEAFSDVPDAKPVVKGEQTMSTQEQKVYDVTVVQRTEVLHKGSGVVEKINRDILFDSKVCAVTEESAKQKALAVCAETAAASGKTLDFDALEITCKPF